MKINKKIIVFCAITIIFISLFSLIFIYKININNIKGEIYNLTETNGVLTVNIEDVKDVNVDDTKYLSWDFKSVKTVKISIDFNGSQSKDKRLEIDIPEGMMYRSYPVKEVTDFDIQTKLEQVDMINSIQSIISPPIIINDEIKLNTMKKSSYGKLIYNFENNVNEIEISINLKVDEYKYYGLKNVLDAIKINVYDQTGNVGSFSRNVQYNGGKSLRLYKTSSTAFQQSRKVIASTNENNYYGNTPIYKVISGYDTISSIQFPYIKTAILSLYIPEGMIYDDDCSVYLNGILQDEIKKFEYDEKENRVDLYLVDNFNKSSSIGFGLTYKVGKLPLGTYAPRAESKALVTFYDDTTFEIKPTSDYEVEVINEDSIVNNLTITSGYSLNLPIYEDNNNETYVQGPAFIISNDDPKEKTNQAFEFIIPENYQVININIAKEMYGKILSAKYQTNKSKSTWIDYPFKQNLNNRIVTFYKTTAGLSIDEYFTRFKVVIDKYGKDYVSSSGSPKGPYNATLYGNLKAVDDSKKETNEAIIQFYNYDESNYNDICYTDISSDSCNTWTKFEAKVAYSEDKQISPLYTDNIENIKFDKKTINAGESFVLSGYINTNAYPYDKKIYMDNVEIYIRQPIGISLNVNDIVIKDEDNNSLNIKGIIRSENRDNGDFIYKIITGKTVGYYFLKNNSLTSKKLHVTIPFSTDKACELGSISLDDIISWGNNEYKLGKIKVTDKYDLDCDGSTQDEIISIGTESLTINPIKTLILSSNIVKDGTIYLPYNPSNLETIAKVYKDDEFIYNVNLKNNTETTIENYELIVPIPKKNNDYGINYQLGNFNFDIALRSKVLNTSDYEVEYGIKDGNEITYHKDIESLKDVVMLKIKSSKALETREIKTIEIPMKINSNEKIESNDLLNVWNSVVKYQQQTITSEFKGNKVAVKLLEDYELDFNINNLILAVNEQIDITIENIKPIYFENIKGNPGYTWKVLEDFKEYISIENKNERTTTIKALKPINNAILEVTIHDDTGKYKTKSFNVKIVENKNPIIRVQDQELYVGDEIDFLSYVIEAIDYKGQKIDDIKFESTIPISDGKVIQKGEYQVKYIVTDDYGNSSQVKINIIVKEKTIINEIKDIVTNPSTKDTIFIISGLLILSSTILAIAIKKNK